MKPSAQQRSAVSHRSGARPWALGRRAANYTSKVRAKGRVRHACLGGKALSPASSPKTLCEVSRARLAASPCPCACPQGRGRCGNPEKHRINSHPAPPCTKFCAGHRMAHRAPAQAAKRPLCVCAALVDAALRPRGRRVPRSLGMCVRAKMYYGLWGECCRFRAVWLTRCVG